MTRILIVILVLCLLLPGCNRNLQKKIPEDINKAVGNDWEESTPREQGINEDILSKSDAFIKEKYPTLYSLLVIRHGYLVYEKYYRDKNRDDTTHVFSVTKSVMSALTGIALDQKTLSSLDQKLPEFFPEYFMNDIDQTKKDITLRNILTMTGGLEPVDKDILSWIGSEDWFRYEINQPLRYKPGEKFIYDTGLTHLLSGILTKAANMSTLDYANKFLFNSLGITNKHWDTDNQGYYGGGHLLQLTPRDMAKFGYLYLNNGMWKGKQVLPASWVKESTQKQISFDKDSGYGYLWWITNKKDNVRNRSFITYSALGFGGQRIDIIPNLELVTVITANPDIRADVEVDTGEILTRFILPAVD